FFFFSSRRRHTRSDRDWSSDVCSSDLRHELLDAAGPACYCGRAGCIEQFVSGPALAREVHTHGAEIANEKHEDRLARAFSLVIRSEERRVGKECRSRWWAED